MRLAVGLRWNPGTREVDVLNSHCEILPTVTVPILSAHTATSQIRLVLTSKVSKNTATHLGLRLSSTVAAPGS